MPVVVVTVDLHISPSMHHVLHETGISGRGNLRGDSGSRAWMAPEINPLLGNSGIHNKATDVWAFGLVR